MKLNQLIKVKTKNKKRLGRGIGSGKGKTAGRGTKGQKARGKIPAGFVGGLPLYKKLPLQRGKGNPKLSKKPKLINLSKLNVFKKGAVLDITKLLEANVILEKDAKVGIKILGRGEVSRALTIKLAVSKGARKKVEEKGGKVEYV